MALFLGVITAAYAHPHLERAVRNPEEVCFVTLSVSSSTQGSITTKNFLWQTNYGSSLVALEYRVADGSSKLLGAGIVKIFDVQKLTTKK